MISDGEHLQLRTFPDLTDKKLFGFRNDSHKNGIESPSSQSTTAPLCTLEHLSVFHEVGSIALLFCTSIHWLPEKLRLSFSQLQWVRYWTSLCSNRSNLYFIGTGKISILFFVFPFVTGAQSMIVLSLIFFYLGLFLYCSFIIILVLKYIYYPDRWTSLLRNPTASMDAGCFPMGAATLINVAVIVINGQLNYGGKSFLYFIWVTWWIDVLISFLCCWVGIHAMYVSGHVSLFPCVRSANNSTCGLGLHSRNTLWMPWPQRGYSPLLH